MVVVEVYSPWSDLARRPHLTFGIVRLPAGHGWWMPDVPGIVLDDRLTRVQRRCVLAHELAHVDLEHDEQVAGACPVGRKVARSRETAADRLAARRLIPVGLLAQHVGWTRNWDEAAEIFDVTVDVLRTRVRGLHPAERGYLAKRAQSLEVSR